MAETRGLGLGGMTDKVGKRKSFTQRARRGQRRENLAATRLVLRRMGETGSE
jgi:hypothetical protein